MESGVKDYIEVNLGAIGRNLAVEGRKRMQYLKG